MLKIVQKLLKDMLKIVQKLLKNRVVQLMVGVLILCPLLMMIYKRIMGEGFQVIDLIVPPLEQVSCVEHAYGCRINGYRVEPMLVYKCLYQGKDNKEDIKYLKYKIVDSDNVTRYTGLYNNLEGVKVGEYITFDNGQEYVIGSLDIESEPKACATIRMRQLKK